MDNKKVYIKFKRIIDFVLSLIGLIVFSPVLVILMIAIKLVLVNPI